MHTVDITPLYNLFNETVQYIVTGLLLAAAGWLRWFLHKYLAPYIGAELEAKAAADLNTALENGASIALVKLQAWETAHKDVAVQGAVQRMAVNYAIDHAPQAINHFGLNEEQLALKVLAYIPAPPPTSAGTTGAVVQTVPVEVKPLP